MNEVPQMLLSDLLPGEQAYPIYSIRSKWSQDFPEGREASQWSRTDGLQEGRMWNGTQWFKMPCDTATIDLDLLAKVALAEARTVLVGEKYRDLNPLDLSVNVEFRRWEVWCGGWFGHWTWDVGLSDEQILESFDRFVDRMKCLNDREPDAYCLMGAEDRWRWYGCETGDPGSGRTPPPCRCPMCKQRGVITIGH